jgi:hypothetical protein
MEALTDSRTNPVISIFLYFCLICRNGRASSAGDGPLGSMTLDPPSFPNPSSPLGSRAAGRGAKMRASGGRQGERKQAGASCREVQHVV